MSIEAAFTKAVEAAGSEARLAKLTGYSHHAIWHARKRKRVTPTMALRIARETGVPAVDLCPDLFASSVGD